MDDSVGKVLSWEEKEKLKEKLAFLKREYSKTLARLQRAQRAEKAKNSLKTEQNCMLKQETSIQTNSEPEDKVSLGDKLETCTVQIDACLNAETKEKTTVALDFEPELSNAGDGSGVCPEHIDDNCQENFLYRITEPDNKKKQNKQPLNRMKTQKKTLVSKESESFFSSDSLINAGQRQQKQVFATENPELSVFQVKNHFSCGEREIQNSHRPITEMNECLVAPANELKNDASAILEENNLPERATLSLHNPLDDSNIQQLECVPLEDVCDNYKLTTQYSMNLIHGSPKKLEEGEKEHVISPGDQMINVDMNVNKKMSSILTLPSDDRAFSANERNHSLSKNTHFDEHNHSLKPLGSCSNILDSRGESFQKKEVLSETANPNIEIISPVPTENPLNSCTVLDGLLFPVEYYVRTTRQMSNCQRAVDLEAVIQSQLGVKRKGFKHKCKQVTKNLDLSSQEQSELLLSDQGNSSSPFQKSFSSATEGSPAALPTKDNDCALKACKRKGFKHKCKQVIKNLDLSSQEQSELLLSDQGNSSSPFQRSFSSATEGSPAALPTKDNDCALKTCKRRLSRRHRGRIFFCKKGIDDQDSELQVSDNLDIKKPKEDVALFKEAPRKKERVQGKKTVTNKSSCILANVDKKAPTSIIQGKQDYIQNKDLHSSIGATPVFGSQIHSGNVASEITGPTFCTPRHTNLKKQNNLTGDNQCNNSPNALKFDTNMHSLGGEVKKQPDQIVPSSEKKFDSDCGSQEILPSVDSITFKERPLLESTFQTKVAEHPAEIWCDSLKLGNLQLLSQLKNPSDSCSVDVSTVWWEVTGCKESCIITACEFTVSLWKSLDNWQWRKVYTWHFTEIPVLQIIPLWDACNLVCVALGHLEIREIRLLFCSDDECLKQSLVKSGNIKAVLGLRHKRLVCSNGTLHDHQVDLMTFSASGRSKEKQTLMSPEETILAFAEVQGMQDALLGTTLMSSIVIWNLKTGQLLKKMQIGNSYQASICHKAYSDMGLLFVVLSHPHGKEIESMGTPIFRLIVINPKTALSVDVQPYSLPQGHTGRFLDGEVKDNLAAAVLTSGTIAVWDLFLGHCTALLLPNSDGNWSFVKWSGTDSCLLAGQKNGSVFVYSYI
ncbi:partner and localizer of BRCA2 isoform X2 [Petaurus breviceps papuanus]|uniref:partner and localizer of BRCA2 isoform X2 n=1 Tax=Petaurus breviceps papuanus TaxID=3040969 RepID=UPI0036DC3C84